MGTLLTMHYAVLFLILFSDRLHSLQQMLSRTFKLHNPDSLTWPIAHCGQLLCANTHGLARSAWFTLGQTHTMDIANILTCTQCTVCIAQSPWFTLEQALKSATSDLPYFVLERCGRFCGWIVPTFFWSFTLDYTLSQILFSYFVNPLSLFHHQTLFHTPFTDPLGPVAVLKRNNLLRLPRQSLQ